jgi:hypothetical protein
MKGFSQKWCQWIDQIVSGGSVGVMVNDELGHFFQTKKGLKTGGSTIAIALQHSGIYVSNFD